MDNETIRTLKPSQPSKKSYHVPNVRVYGDLKQLTLTTAIPVAEGDGPFGYYAAS